jgi:putative Mg2+ transporter-C (MgtC) family protein
LPEKLAISQLEVVARLLAAVALCGIIIGLEREIRDQPAGFRTHILLGVGAAMFTLVSAYGFPEFTGAASTGGIQFDPTRIAAQIVTGVGFLGAGAIIREGRDVRGLTTAGSLWTAAAIGVATGAGYLFSAAAATEACLATLYALRRIRTGIDSRLRIEFSTITLTLRGLEHGSSEALRALERHGMIIRDLEADVAGERARYRAQVKISPSRDIHAALAEASRMPGVEKISASSLHGPAPQDSETQRGPER